MNDRRAEGAKAFNSLARRLYQRDPLLVLVRDKLHIGLGWSTAGMALLTGGVILGWPALLKSPEPSGGFVVGLVQSFIIFPLGILIYMLLPGFLAGLFTTLQEKKAIGDRRQAGVESYDRFLARWIDSANNAWWMAIALGLVLLYWLYRLFANVPGDVTLLTPKGLRTWQRLTILLVYTPVMYGAALSLVRLVIGVIFTQRLFHLFKIRVNPLNPDGAGGLGVIGQKLTISVLFATALGAGATGMIIFDISAGHNPFLRPETWALGAIYLALTPLLFATWLWLPHRALLEAREEALKPLADEFLHAMSQAEPSHEDDAQAIKAKTERLAEIKRQYEFLRDTFPTWPLQNNALNRLVATSGLPLISSLVSGLIPGARDAILRLLGK
jgi:hypothetical protein